MIGENHGLCRDNIWDRNLTWESNNPDFTECFQQFILVILPCLTFLFVATVYLILTRKDTVNIRLPWSYLLISKMILCCLLICISAIEFGIVVCRRFMDLNILEIDVYVYGIKTVTYVAVLVVLIRNKDMGKRSSTLLTIFWLFMTIFGIIILRSIILRAFHKMFLPIEKYKYIPELIYFPVLFLQFFLSLFLEPLGGIPLEEKNPVETAPLFSFISFSWFNSLIYKGKKQLLNLEDLPPLPKKLDASYLWKQFEDNWNNELQRYHQLYPSDAEQPGARLTLALIKSFWPWMLCASIFQMFDCVLVFVPPQILDVLLNFMSGKDYVWKGYVLCVALFAMDFLTRITYNCFMYYSECFAFQLQNTLISAIYRKAMKLSNESRRKYTSGEIMNLVSVDIEKIYNFCSYFTFGFGSPIKVILTVLFLWMYLGASCLSGVAVLTFILGINAYASRKLTVLQGKQMETKDQRLKYVTEVLNGIRVLKLYAWEIPFIKKITEIRNREVQYSRIYQLFFSILTFFWGSTPFLVAIASFVTYILSSSNHVLSPTTVFVSLNLLNILRSALLEVPELTTDMIQVVISMKRISLFLSCEESEHSVGNNPDPGKVLSMREATLKWNKKDEPILKDIYFHLEKGDLVAIVGQVGSGKSSLLSAILGHMYKTSGSIDVQGKIAYVPQQAWILNRTVKENILFMKPISKSIYESVLEGCCLKPDLEILPAGDETEIGEKGVNLSGGQKQRVSLARAVYHNADIYFLDDPLSAVDAHVGKHIFDHVIGKNGLLKNKSRILVTHNISILPEADVIISMKDGRIEEMGTYDELMNHQLSFSELIEEFSMGNTDNDEYLLSEDTTMLRNRHSTKRSISVQSKERTISVDSKTMVEPAGRLTEEESMEVGEVKRSTFIRYIKFMSLKVFFCMILGYFLYVCFDFAANVWLSRWSNDPPPVNGTQDNALKNLRIGIYTVFGFSEGLFIAMGGICLALGTTNASKRLHFHMLESVMRAPISFFDTTPMGRMVNRFGRDMEDIDTKIPMYIDGGIVGFFETIGIIALIGSSLPFFLPFLIPLALMYYFIQKFYLIISRQLKRLSATTHSPVYSHLTESIQGSSSIDAYQINEPFVQKLENLLNSNCTCQFLWSCCTRWLEMRLALIADIVILVTSILAVVARENIEASFLGLAILYALTIADVLTWLVRTVTELENRAVSVERVTEFSVLKSESPWKILETTPPRSWPSSGAIEFKDYSTRYRQNLDLVLRNINLKIKGHEKVGIVGRTGAGKSSFALALFRIIEPVAGCIIIDEIDVSRIGLHELRSKLTIIPQDPVLFTGQLRINLDPNEEYTDDQVWSSLEHSNLKIFVSSLPEGLLHEVAEGGSNLSVGQRQLICLARALLKKTKILVLDEATAAVDVETDQLIQNTIRNKFKDHTVITIAHRLNTIMDYDRVLVMDLGKIMEDGKPSDLLENENSSFYKMAKDAGIL